MVVDLCPLVLNVLTLWNVQCASFPSVDLHCRQAVHLSICIQNWDFYKAFLTEIFLSWNFGNLCFCNKVVQSRREQKVGFTSLLWKYIIKRSYRHSFLFYKWQQKSISLLKQKLQWKYLVRGRNVLSFQNVAGFPLQFYRFNKKFSIYIGVYLMGHACNWKSDYFKSMFYKPSWHLHYCL